jgi:hypothetical protein
MAGYRSLPSKSEDIAAQARRNAAFMGTEDDDYDLVGTCEFCEKDVREGEQDKYAFELDDLIVHESCETDRRSR